MCLQEGMRPSLGKEVITAMIGAKEIRGYLERAVQSLRDQGTPIDENLLPHLSPLGWEHINLTGDYIWGRGKAIGSGKFRPLRRPVEA